MANMFRLVDQLKRAARSNPDAVRGALDKVEGVINTRTGGKHADKIARGRRGLNGAIGVPGDTRRGFRQGAHDGDVRPGPVPPPGPVAPPTPVWRDDTGR